MVKFSVTSLILLKEVTVNSLVVLEEVTLLFTGKWIWDNTGLAVRGRVRVKKGGKVKIEIFCVLKKFQGISGQNLP